MAAGIHPGSLRELLGGSVLNKGEFAHKPVDLDGSRLQQQSKAIRTGQLFGGRCETRLLGLTHIPVDWVSEPIDTTRAILGLSVRLMNHCVPGSHASAIYRTDRAPQKPLHMVLHTHIARDSPCPERFAVSLDETEEVLPPFYRQGIDAQQRRSQSPGLQPV